MYDSVRYQEKYTVKFITVLNYIENILSSLGLCLVYIHEILSDINDYDSFDSTPGFGHDG